MGPLIPKSLSAIQFCSVMSKLLNIFSKLLNIFCIVYFAKYFLHNIFSKHEATVLKTLAMWLISRMIETKTGIAVT